MGRGQGEANQRASQSEGILYGDTGSRKANKTSPPARNVDLENKKVSIEMPDGSSAPLLAYIVGQDDSLAIMKRSIDGVDLSIDHLREALDREAPLTAEQKDVSSSNSVDLKDREVSIEMPDGSLEEIRGYVVQATEGVVLVQRENQDIDIDVLREACA